MSHPRLKEMKWFSPCGPESSWDEDWSHVVQSCSVTFNSLLGLVLWLGSWSHWSLFSLMFCPFLICATHGLHCKHDFWKTFTVEAQLWTKERVVWAPPKPKKPWTAQQSSGLRRHLYGKCAHSGFCNFLCAPTLLAKSHSFACHLWSQ